MAVGELIDVINEQGMVVDTIPREEAEREGYPMQNVLVFVFNSLGRVWVGRRAPDKKHFPDLWDVTACGAPFPGEDLPAAASRELAEETGLNVDTLHGVTTFKNDFNRPDGTPCQYLSHVFLGISDDTPQPSKEVSAFEVWEPASLREDAVAHPQLYVPPFIVELDMVMQGVMRL